MNEIMLAPARAAAANHLYVGITRLKLGRLLLRAERYADAVHRPRGRVRRARRPQDAEKLRAKLASSDGK
jgi:hypothetical protein